MADIEKSRNPSNDQIAVGMKDLQEGADVVHVEGETMPHGLQNLHIDEALERRVVRKLDWNIMPIVTALCT